MPGAELVDHSPHHPSPADPLPNATNLVLIDNYDSFTWNVYQYLVLEGATVTVHRNDQVTLQELVDAKPTQLVVSPGPGHPDRDAGVSKEAIKYFGGKIPVLGVCMGEQCMYSVFGGIVGVTGEILHGKTSLLTHDGKGVYEGLRQELPVTRYHSLAGTHKSLPRCLEISSRIAAGPNEQEGVIMGVRHREYIVEGVQFHPESILTEEGRPMLRNFLKFQGGTWADNARQANQRNGEAVHLNGHNTATQIPQHPKSQPVSILEEIFARRQAVVEAQMQIPSYRFSDLQAAYDMDLAPPLVSFRHRLEQSPYRLSLMAEIKRASPSKGVIAIDACAPLQARQYALAGASVISVLTEPDWFKGSLDDLRAVRQSLAGMVNRPAVLRKEFIFNEYQVLEARLAGADTVLLIVKMLTEKRLGELYVYSKSLGMEPLVEVNNIEEMTRARKLNAQVIGVNNRNLVTFDVDLETTSRLVDLKPASSILCALSGISKREDVEPYEKNGVVQAILVGEALMRDKDIATAVQKLTGGPAISLSSVKAPEMLVKICGTRTPVAAKVAIEAGADLIGMILVEGRKRFVPEDTAIAISEVVHNTLKDRQNLARHVDRSHVASDFFTHTSENHVSARHRALLVGVFQDQPLSHILQQQRMLDLDVVQLHGSEPLEWASLIPVPVIRSFKPGTPGLATRGYHATALLDAGSGGSGQTLQHADLQSTLAKDNDLRIFLAGGLESNNVASKVQELGPAAARVVGVDVSSGVEVNGEQDVEKIRAFITAAKTCR